MQRLVVPAVLLLAACKQDTGLGTVSNVDTFRQAPTNQVDILFVIDDSHSMVEEQANIAAGFDSFISAIESTNTDFQIGIVTTSFEYDDPDRGVLVGTPQVINSETPNYSQEFKNRVQVGVFGSDKEKGLEVAEYATSAIMTTGANSGFLRPDAFFLLVILSDEEDCSDAGALEGLPSTACYQQRDDLTPVNTFVDHFTALKTDPSYVRIGAIVGPRAEDGACEDSTPGTRYMEFATDMGGTVGNICDPDYSNIMSTLGLVATGVVDSFQLSEAAQEDTIVVNVGLADDGSDAVEIPPDPINGWTYDAVTHYVTFHGTSVPARGAVIAIEYTVLPGG